MKKILKILLCVCAFVMFKNTAMAAQDYIYLGDQIPGIRLYLKTPIVEKYKGMFEIINQTTGEYVYCIEPGVVLKDGYFTSYQMLGEVDLAYPITNEDWEYLRTIANYGYGYKDRTDIKWYAATQFMIWEYILQDIGEIYFVDENNQKIDLLKDEIAAIQNDLDHHEDIPSFLGNDEEIQVRLGDTITLTDELDILDEFTIFKSNVEVDVNQNQLSVTFTTPGYQTVRFKKHFTSGNIPRIYASSSNQAVISKGVIDVPYEILKFNVQVPTFQLIKKSSDEASLSLAGAKYGIYYEDGTLLREVTTDQDGMAYLSEIYPGKYYLQEIEAPYGYYLNTEKIDFEVKQEDVVIEVVDQIIKKEIPIEKYLENLDGTYELESDATFQVYDVNNHLVTTFKTNEYGKYMLSLPYGKYTLKQVGGNKGYHFTEDIILNVNEDLKSDALIIKNPQIKGSLYVEKKDADTDELIIEEAVFQIINVDTNQVFEIDGKSQFTTINGTLSISDIPYGNYKLVEITSPHGYKLTEEEYVFAITGDEEIKLEVDNEMIKGSLLIEKKDVDTNNLILEEATFKIVNTDTGEVFTVDGKDVLKTEDGKLLVVNIPYGSYKLIEIEAPKGYKLTQEEYVFSILTEEEIQMDVYNELIKGSLQVLKIDEDTDKPVMEEATFQIINVDTNQVFEINGKRQFTTVDGTLLVSNIPYGNYKLVEIEAPLGYQLKEEEYYFSITEETKITIEVDNKMIQGFLLIEKIDVDTDNLILEEATFQIINVDTNQVFEIDGKSQFTTVDGKLFIPNLPYGNYKLVEIEAPSGYQIAELEYPFNITKEELIQVSVYNELSKGVLVIEKLGCDDLEPLQGVLFGLYDQEQKLIEEYATDQDGKIVIEDLLPGIYYVKELNTVDGYELLEGFLEVEIKAQVENSLTVVNRLKIEVPKTGVNEFLLTILFSASCLFVGVLLCNYDKNR